MSGATGLLLDTTPLRESPAFRRIFVARLISLLGIGMLLVSVPVQMWDLTGSSAHVGAATAVTGITTFVGMVLGGLLADRFDRRRLILVGRTGAALAFAALAANAFGAFGGVPRVSILYTVAGLDGIVGALSTSALMAAVPTLIAREHLAAVGAMNALTVRIGAALSPAVAGFLIAAAGVEWAYTVATVLATTTVLILTGLPSLPPGAAHHAPPVNAADRSSTPPSLFGFLVADRVVASVMAVGVVSMFGAGVVALLPALVAQRFGDDPAVTGLLYAAVAGGAMISALVSGWIPTVRRPGLLLLWVLPPAFGCQILFGLTPYGWAAIGLLMLVGFLDTVGEILRYSLIQQRTPGPLLGRVNGIWMAQEVAGVTVGALVAGLFGTWWTASQAVIYYGLILAVGAVGAAVAFRTLAGVDMEADPQTDD
ncbi:enterobactin transporter EntS [Gordonia sp. ABSL1-1]|uniref:enterobactin transporter EntS n=1 Tax=Gordonia sp. ABSL1-1 TaxID=3053923 RepID=UPI0025734BF5|nr:enterobactin transporter EntS [Gordonia sp. ABSL1-1]MDL9935869.1 enterobactin transporter EntS [Gordonia sp. ABSL1-1]